MPYDVDHEVRLVQYHIARIGKKEADGSYTITFGDFFADDEVEQTFESLVCTLSLSLFSFFFSSLLLSFLSFSSPFPPLLP